MQTSIICYTDSMGIECGNVGVNPKTHQASFAKVFLFLPIKAKDIPKIYAYFVRVFMLKLLLMAS